MNRAFLALVLSAFTLLCGSVFGQGDHQHQHDTSEKIGRANFKISCSPHSQMQFNRAVAWLHSFEYEEAEKLFTAIAADEPQCAMAYWGIAMSNYHTIWVAPTKEELNKGSAAIGKAKAAGARTARERAFIEALEVFFKDAERHDHRTRTLAYSDAMGTVYNSDPSDIEASVFYALTLIAKGMMTDDKTYADQKTAARILNHVLTLEPEHPGVTHYLIHSYDYPALANLALPAARRYAAIAPASAHARHMPSHIFIRLGLWPEAVRSNLDAKAAAKAFAARNGMKAVWDEEFHAMDYLAYAYLQDSDDRRALGVVNELNLMGKADPETFKVAYAYTAIPARYALERRQWKEAARLTLAPDALGGFPWQRFTWAGAHITFARAVGMARTGDTASARKEIETLAAVRQQLSANSGNYDWGKQVEIEHGVASAWLAYADGNRQEAIRLMRAAADLDDATDKHPVTPGSILPPREQLGELLLEINDPAAALAEYENSLKSTPNRFQGVYGAARAAERSGDRRKARIYYSKLVELSGKGDTVRPEIVEAKEFLSRQKGR